tara:strand:- start:253 stop:1365 length:1113 start_codon:yes stop_codon:yes gene_type:complete
MALAQQAASILLVVAAFLYLGTNISRNLAESGMTGGFGFLWQEAGFAMSFSLIEMDETSTYGRVFVAGILNTLFVAVLALVAATVLGLVIGFMRASSSRPLRLISSVYVEAFRNVPMLLILIFVQTVVLRSLPIVREAVSFGDVVHFSNRGFYFPWPVTDQDLRLSLAAGLAACVGFGAAWILRTRTPIHSWRDLIGSLIGTILGLIFLGTALGQITWQFPAFSGFDFKGGAKLMPEFAALLLTLTIYNAAFIAEIVRAGLQSVDRGQVEAARALGLRNGFIQRRIIMPQALRLMVPPITNQYVHLVKASSLATVVGFPDLVAVFLGTSLNQTGRAIEIVAMTAAVYLILCLGLGALSAVWNARVSLTER